MKIKKFSAIGFKSFMEKLDIPIPSGISAIVGPNGCGKSNVVDAIRWAMGEQSAKLLRGRQMEDVIFSGADEHKPLGMAEVSIVFENGDGSFPKEFAHCSELSITRRLYRSGESEYLINNVPCRLKDIQEVFMDTGLGNRAYSIIGQGRIGAIVDQKPEETRAMVEEAAGITKYKKKVDDSRRKIELTKGNLQRVEDILGEVERQMRSLKRQAGKARRFKRIGEEIRSLELVLKAHTYDALQKESVHRKKSTEEFTQEERVQAAAYASFQGRMEKMSLTLDEKEAHLSEKTGRYQQLKEKVAKREASQEAMVSEKRMQEDLKGRLRKEREDLQRRLEELEGERVALGEKIEGARKITQELENEGAVIAQRLKSREVSLGRIREEYEEAKGRVHSGVSQEMSLAQESGYLNNRIGEITDKRARLDLEKTEVNEKMKEVIQASNKKNAVREALVQKLDHIQEEINKEKENRDELDRMRLSLEGRLKSAEGELHVHQSRLASLKSLVENFEGYKVGVRTVMKAEDLDSRRKGRIKGLVADILQVEPRLEQAVEAVLGDKLQHIIVENQEDAKEAVDYLKKRVKGRGSFIPLKALKSEHDPKTQNDLPLLRDLVTVPEPYKPVLDALFGDTVLADDLSQAIDIWNENLRHQCLVTYEGDILERSGVVSGGQIARASQGFLARKREIKDLAKKVSEGQKEVREAEAKLKRILTDLDERARSLTALEEEKELSKEKINDLDKINFRLSHELDQLEKLLARLTEEQERENKEQSKHTEALTRVESELAQCKERREQEEVYLRAKEIELRESEAEFENIRNELGGLKMEQSRSLEQEKGLLRELDRIHDFIHEGNQMLSRLEKEITTAQERYQECLQREEELREELKALYDVLSQAQERVHRAEYERQLFQKEIKEEEKKGEALRHELEDIREKIHRAKMEESEISFKMNGLVEQVREMFNLNLATVYADYLQEDYSRHDLEERLERKKEAKERLGEVNLTAIQEHEALTERHTFITDQRDDLVKSIESLTQAIRKINKTSLEKFMETFVAVDKKLKEVFPILFSGGEAGLKLMDETKPLESGILVEVRPPGKRLSHMGLLSGGEKALVAMALLFAIYLIKPSPFCLLDEVDAPLDEANVDRFNNLLQEIKKHSQVILVTHNKRSMEIVDRLYGITMEKKGISKIVSVDLQTASMN